MITSLAFVSVCLFVCLFHTSTFLHHEHFQFASEQLAGIATACRPHIKLWLKSECSTGPGTKQWRRDLQNCFVKQILSSTTHTWRQIMQFAARQIQGRYCYSSRKVLDEIEKAVEKYLKKSPAQEILKPKAYQWLKYLEANPPTASWYPRHAIEVAYEAFRLNTKMETFRKYLSHPTRRQFLKSIFPDSCLRFGKLCPICPVYSLFVDILSSPVPEIWL